MLQQRRSRHSPSTSSGSNMAQPETVPKEKGDSTSLPPHSSPSPAQEVPGSQPGGKNDARARQELPTELGRLCLTCLPFSQHSPSRALALIPHGHLPSPTDVIMPVALALSHQRACSATGPRQTPTSVATRE